jgi:hypothetical protein
MYRFVPGRHVRVRNPMSFFYGWEGEVVKRSGTYAYIRVEGIPFLIPFVDPDLEIKIESALS